MKARYTFTLDPDAVEALKAMARSGSRSQSSMVESAIMQTFDRYLQKQKETVDAREEALAEIKKGELAK